MMRNSVVVAGVMGMMAVSAEAGIPTGATAYFTGAAVDSDGDFGGVPDTYAASVTNASPAASASATLVWGASSYSFTGNVSGDVGSTIFAYSNGIATFTFTDAMSVTMSWDFSNVAGKSADSLAGWQIVLQGASDPVYGIQFEDDPLVPTSVAGVPASNSASGVTRTLAAGTYTISTGVQVDVPASGNFTVTMSFTPVPAPGVAPMLLAAAFTTGGRRRRP